MPVDGLLHNERQAVGRQQEKDRFDRQAHAPAAGDHGGGVEQHRRGYRDQEQEDEAGVGEALQEYYSVRNVEGVRNTTINRIEVAMKSLFTMMNPRTSLFSLDERVLDRYKRHCKEILNLIRVIRNFCISKCEHA